MTFDPVAASTARIDLSEWVDAALRDEQIVTSPEHVTAQIASGVPLSKVARNAIVSRQGGAAPEDLLASNRTLLHIGAYQDVHKRFIRTALQQVTAANGKKYRRSRFIGGPHEAPDADADPTFQMTADDLAFDLVDLGYADSADDEQREKALAWATAYITETVPGHTWKHLIQVYALGGDVKTVAKQLKKEIDVQVRRLTDPQLALDAE